MMSQRYTVTVHLSREEAASLILEIAHLCTREDMERFPSLTDLRQTLRNELDREDIR